MSKGFIFYHGPSVLDGEPLVGICTWGTKNRKTGNELQTWLLRADVTPVDAVQSGKDASVCGDCRWRHVHGEAPICYVTRFHAPRAVYAAYSDGKYPLRFPDRIRGTALRFGSYGDPYSIPLIVWERLIFRVKAPMWTGYTQFWKKPEAQDLKQYCMASVATEREREEANDLGWRTFRITIEGGALLENEVHCPHYSKGVQCAACGLCAGTSRPSAKDIAAPIHGARAAQFELWYQHNGEPAEHG